ncbi:hypothetical protein J6590_022699 [Homalodisca vitripennis]|nr:hypothetical protein J6590_022699 [Homalodisca vitripennis]
MFLYMASYMLSTVVEQAFFVHKACTVDLRLPADTCAAINTEEHKEDYKKVQLNRSRGDHAIQGLKPSLSERFTLRTSATFQEFHLDSSCLLYLFPN